jgi:hemoglobin
MLKKIALVAATLSSLVSLGGCATEPQPPAPQPSLYQRLGGLDALDAVVADALANVAADARINQRFNVAGLPKLKKNLVDLLCERTGGPCTYTGLDMSAAHEGMNIRDDEFDALVEDMVKSLDKFKVPARDKGELMAALGKMKNAIVGH